MNQQKVSVIVPAHNEELNIPTLISALADTFRTLHYNYEIILIDDGSSDNTLSILIEQAKVHENVFYIELSKNFGKDNALKVGIDLSRSDCVITMDADLQHPPSLIPQMLSLWQQGYDTVYTYRNDDNPHAKKSQKKTSKLFYKVINFLSDIELEDGIADFRLLDNKVVSQIKNVTEYSVFLRGLIKWVGFKQIGIPYTPAKRYSGEASYSFYSLIKLAVNGIMSFSVKPLYLATGIGLFFSLTAVLYIPYVLISYFSGFSVSGWASLLATVVFFGGMQLMVLGIIGMYLGKLFMQAKNRPNYIIRSSNLLPNKP